MCSHKAVFVALVAVSMHLGDAKRISKLKHDDLKGDFKASAPGKTTSNEFPAGYEELSAEIKINSLWKRILGDEGVAADFPSATAPLRLFAYLYSIPVVGWLFSWTEDLSTTFSHVSDTSMPYRHKKVIHPVGSIAKAALEWDRNATEAAGYTGLFAQDQMHTLLRIAPAGSVKETGMAPGLALKVLRDGIDSANTFALYTLRGQHNSFSQFEHLLCNKLGNFRDQSTPESWLLKSFETQTKYPFTTGLSHWTKGAESNKFPFVLCFKPTEAARAHVGEAPAKFEHIQEQIGGFGAGDVLYDIYAAAEPRVEPTKIGQIKLMSGFQKSKWADATMFFRHDKFETDLALRPDWKEQVDAEDFWYEEGANNFYSSLDSGGKDEGMGKNAWGGGYNPDSIRDAASDAKKETGSVSSMLQLGGGCPFGFGQTYGF